MTDDMIAEDMEIQNAGLISDETEFPGSLSNNVYCLSYLHTLHSLWIQGVKCFILQMCPQPTLIAKFPQAGSHEPTNTHLREAKSLDQDASSSYPFDIQAAKHLLSLSSTPSAVKNLAKNPSSSAPAQTQIQLTHQEHGGACQVSRTLPLHPHGLNPTKRFTCSAHFSSHNQILKINHHGLFFRSQIQRGKYPRSPTLLPWKSKLTTTPGNS